MRAYSLSTNISFFISRSLGTLLLVLLLTSWWPVSKTAAWNTRTLQQRPARQSHLGAEKQQQQLGQFEPLPFSKQDQSRRRVLFEVYQSPVEFHKAWQRQQELYQQQVARLTRADSSSSSFVPQHSSNVHQHDSNDHQGGFDRILLLQHEPVYTLGTASDASFILKQQQQSTKVANNNNRQIQIPTVRMDRGGEVTYHGPGQWTCYPVLDLRNYNTDIHWYVRALEQVALIAMEKAGLPRATRQFDTTGVWHDDHKLAAIGVKCRRWITQHGLAVNVIRQSLDGFAGIVPCGLVGRKVGCVNDFLETPVTMDEFAVYIQEALEDVFRITLVNVRTED
jgi:lipoyl(octanoyl) transferase